MNDAGEDWRDPVVEVYKRSIDRTLLRANLKLTVTERLQNAMEHARFADELRRVGRELRASQKAKHRRSGAEKVFDRVTIDPAVMTGKPCIRGLRFPVSRLLGLLASGESEESILRAHPYLEAADIGAVLRYAAWLAEGEMAD